MKRTIFFTAAFLSLLGLMESRAQNMQNNRNMEKLKLTEEWDKTFPKSDKVDHSKVTFVNRFGITLAADLYVPKIAVADKFPAIAVSGPFVQFVGNSLRVKSVAQAIAWPIVQNVAQQHQQIIVMCIVVVDHHA